jgi:uncharacterized membrane protein
VPFVLKKSRVQYSKKENAMRNKWWAKLLRILGILLMSLTAAFTLMGGAGATCVALNPTGFGDTFAPIAQVQWLYILFVLLGVAIGVMGVRAVILLVKGTKKAVAKQMEYPNFEEVLKNEP